MIFKTGKSTWRFLPFILAAGMLVYFAATVNYGTDSSEGETLAQQHCGNCHVFPDPSLLDKKTWDESVLPQMAFRLGFKNASIYAKINPQDLPVILKTIPAGPALTDEEWQLIRRYYLENAPDRLTLHDTMPENTIRQFSIHRPEVLQQPFITLLKFDTLTHRFYIGDQSSWLRIFDNNLTLVDSILLDSPPSDISVSANGLLISLLGILWPNDQAKGKLVHTQVEPGAITTVLDSLQRPVSFRQGDITNDGRDDIIVCAFGNYTGALLAFENTGSGYVKHILSSTPGARKVEIRDFDNDGLPDIMALMTQGDERIVLYRNKGAMTFEEKVLIRLPPVYGSNYFELADFNADGHYDILFTNGDNGDFSPVVKPYHAVRIFQNDGENNFDEVWSFPMPGASQAVAEDFDKDGDLDIAAISFFPDFERHPERGFIYFENLGKQKFQPQTNSIFSDGRWLVMEKADFDGDGNVDIILGSSSYRGLGANTDIHQHWQEKKTPLLVLRNGQ